MTTRCEGFTNAVKTYGPVLALVATSTYLGGIPWFLISSAAAISTEIGFTVNNFREKVIEPMPTFIQLPVERTKKVAEKALLRAPITSAAKDNTIKSYLSYTNSKNQLTRVAHITPRPTPSNFPNRDLTPPYVPLNAASSPPPTVPFSFTAPSHYPDSFVPQLPRAVETASPYSSESGSSTSTGSQEEGVRPRSVTVDQPTALDLKIKQAIANAKRALANS